MRRWLRFFVPLLVVVALFGACVALQSLTRARFIATVTPRAPLPQSECVSRFESFGYSEMTAREELCAPGLHGTWYHAVVRNVGHSIGNPISENPLHVDHYVADCRNRTGNQIPI